MPASAARSTASCRARCPARLLCRGVLELMEQTDGVRFGAYAQALLMSERTGQILAPSQTLDSAGIDSGDTLHLV